MILLGTYSSSAQQDPQYTQYMYNTQVINPAYVGSREAWSFGLIGSYPMGKLRRGSQDGDLYGKLPYRCVG